MPNDLSDKDWQKLSEEEKQEWASSIGNDDEEIEEAIQEAESDLCSRFVDIGQKLLLLREKASDEIKKQIDEMLQFYVFQDFNQF